MAHQAVADIDRMEVFKVFNRMDPHLDAIIRTGHGSEQAAREGKALGAAGCLTRPRDLGELLEKLFWISTRRKLNSSTMN